jgi:isoleucyl-tRNA synthetase
MFRQNLDKLTYPQIEEEILKFWQEKGIFEKSISTRSEENPLHFMKAPPQQTAPRYSSCNGKNP